MLFFVLIINSFLIQILNHIFYFVNDFVELQRTSLLFNKIYQVNILIFVFCFPFDFYDIINLAFVSIVCFALNFIVAVRNSYFVRKFIVFA